MTRIRYNVLCPTCKARPQSHCRTLTTGRVTDTHRAREIAQMDYRARTRNDPIVRAERAVSAVLQAAKQLADYA